MSSSPTKYDFTGKVALVTGSSSGIGAAIAIQLAHYGARVVITGQNSENLAKVAAKIAQVSPTKTSPLVIVGNLTQWEFPRQLIDQTIATFGSLDFLVNNAGGSTVAGTLAHAQMLPEFDRILKLNLRTAVELTQLVVPHLEKTRGCVVNISSMASMLPYALVYCTSKAALDMVTKTSALELGPKGIRVNSINPGFVETSIFRSRGWDQSTIDSFYPEIAERSLMGRVGTPEDIANLTSFLISEDARNITGSIYLSDSGCLLAPPSLGDIYQKIDNK